MGRKFRATEISGEVRIPHHQHTHANYFCVNCHCVGSLEQHYGDCPKHESYAIVASAEVPKKNAPKRIWDIFKKQFVFAKPQSGYWPQRKDSWWEKHHGETSEEIDAVLKLEKFRREKAITAEYPKTKRSKATNRIAAWLSEIEGWFVDERNQNRFYNGRAALFVYPDKIKFWNHIAVHSRNVDFPIPADKEALLTILKNKFISATA